MKPFSVIQLDKRGGKVGAVLAAVVFTACCIWYSPKAGLLFAALYLAAGFLRIRTKRLFSGLALNSLWGVVCIFLSCGIATAMVCDTGFLTIGSYRVVMNLVCAAIVYGICLAAAGEIKSAVGIGSGLLLILATANAFVFRFRGNELKAIDILSVGTALNVAGQYSFQLSASMAYSWMLWLWSVWSLRCLPSVEKIAPKRWIRLAAAAATAVCVLVIGRATEIIPLKMWGNEGTAVNGYYLNFAAGLRACFVEEPDHYSPETMEALEQAYADLPETDCGSKPNIIVIMNESYADFEILGSELKTNQPVTPFLDSLEENTIRGHALTSVFGGTTANAEFEFLTGLSMANLPSGSVPYQQYINADFCSLARILETYGYENMATHPYQASGWNRTKVYPYFGFREMTFVESYPQENLIREFVSDREMYEYVLQAIADSGDEPLFLFGITMQNHGDYVYSGDNYAQTVFLEGYEGEYPMAEQYLTLLHESDKAVEYLLTELEKYPEDTVVLFFGDHFPQVEGDFFREVHGGGFEGLSQQMLQYTVPFFIWANYDIPEQTVDCTSLNYLGRYLLEAAGLELQAFYQFLKEMEGVVPAVNAMGYYSPSRRRYLTCAEAEGEEAVWLNRYAILQYNAMFDGNGRSRRFFGEYLTSK